MNEVDNDNSETIDFYEYIRVSEMLLQKSGSNYYFYLKFMEFKYFNICNKLF